MTTANTQRPLPNSDAVSKESPDAAHVRGLAEDIIGAIHNRKLSMIFDIVEPLVLRVAGFVRGRTVESTPPSHDEVKDFAKGVLAELVPVAESDIIASLAGRGGQQESQGRSARVSQAGMEARKMATMSTTAREALDPITKADPANLTPASASSDTANAGGGAHALPDTDTKAAEKVKKG